MSNTKDRLKLLELIQKYKSEDARKRRAQQITTLESFRKELAKVSAWKRAAFERMRKQEKAGDTITAKRSNKAYNYCKGREKQLEHIVDGYEKSLKGNVVFTKDGVSRYRSVADYEKLMPKR